MNKLVAVVDDEKDIAELISINLVKAGFKAKEHHTAQTFLRSLKTTIPDFLVLDLMLPDMDGFEVCKYLRADKKYASIPIIMLTARGEETDRVLGLELGADDYMTKPFSPRELVARVKAILRRTEEKAVSSEAKTIKYDGLTLDAEKFKVMLEGKTVELTTTEFKILEILMSKCGSLFSRDKILGLLWGDEKAVLDRTIDVHIKHLREKLKAWGAHIRNIRGIGYRCE
jgi:DNA-binding response OmpR family regulator